jgi:hypothetical protein
MEKPETASAKKTISIDGDFSDWVDVLPDFRASKGNVRHRDGYGYFDPDSPTHQPLHYTNDTGRNDLVGARVAHDANHVYFMVETARALTSHTDENWMHLFIDADRKKTSGWEGYDFLIGGYGSDGKAVLGRSSGGWKWKKVGTVDYKVAGSKMEIAIPLALLGWPVERPLDLEFKWSDNSAGSGEIMEFYTQGDVAPGGRFNYHYRAPDTNP